MNPVTSLAYRWAIVAPALGLLGEFCLLPWAKGCRGGVPLNSGLPGVARGPGPHALAAPRRLSRLVRVWPALGFPAKVHTRKSSVAVHPGAIRSLCIVGLPFSGPSFADTGTSCPPSYRGRLLPVVVGRRGMLAPLPCGVDWNRDDNPHLSGMSLPPSTLLCPIRCCFLVSRLRGCDL